MDMDKKTNFKVMKRTDYKAPVYTALNVDLTFELDDERTVVKSIVKYRRLQKESRSNLVLNTEDSQIVSIKINDVAVDVNTDSFLQNLKKNIIEIHTPAEDEFTVEIENIINPSANTTLMGLYKSNGTFCTQCEPEGFRRITPFTDRSDILAKYRVTIIAPSYGCGVLLSNGNLVDKGSKDGRYFTVWEDPFPKPSYLFAMVAGTFDIISDTYTTLSGRKVDLELYVDRGSHERGLFAMQSIKDSMKWDEDRWGLEYDLDNFKVVAVDFFNFGAMENKGLNVFNSIYVMVDPSSATDMAFYNVQSVIGHEYFHNYTGDRVTLRDWFQLSLKESLTVFRDQEFSSDYASRALTRLHAINVIRSAQFAEDASPMAHPVRPEQVMEMNNFYSVTIYDKGAEVIRMIHTLLGEERFKKAFREYLSKFDGQAVTIEDFLVCFEESSGADLGQFRRWYTQSGTPVVNASWFFDTDKEKLVLTLEQHTAPTKDQEVKEPFYIPVRISFLDPSGQSIHPSELNEDGIIILEKEKQNYEFSVPNSALPVLLRDFSAPVKLCAPYTIENYQLMMSYCDDAFIKVDSAISMQNRYIHDHMDVDAESMFAEPTQLIDSYRTLLKDAVKSGDLLLINETLKIQSMLSLMETFDNIDIDALFKARSVLEKKLALALYSEYMDVYEHVKASKSAYSVEDMAKRAISNNALHMICVALVENSKQNEASSLVLKHYSRSKNMTDRLQAMTEAVHLNLDCRAEILKSYEKEWSDDALVFDNFFKVQATVPSQAAIENVKELLNHKSFDGNNPNRVRALVGALALSNPVALHQEDGEGYTLLCREVARLNDVNPSVAARILTPLLSFRRFDKKRQALIKKNLTDLMNISSLSRSIYEKVSSALKEE